MQVYLPIAEMSVDVFVLVAIGTVVGFLSGLFGVGGGFLVTPLLIFIGIPPAVAVATQANQVMGSSISGLLAHWRRGNVDFTMGFVLLVGGLLGSAVGVYLFRFLRAVGQIDLVILVSYVVFLGSIGILMLTESVRAMWRRKRKPEERFKLHQHIWLHGLPLKLRFRKSKLYISALLPLVLGFIVGVLVAIMGVGGGFIMVPAMIYLLGMSTSVVVGTSLFQIIFVTANVTLLQAVQNQTVDLLLAVVLLVGGVVGAQFGSRISAKLRGDQLRVLFALLVIGVGTKLLFDLLSTPAELYSIQVVKHL
ncbi:MAG: sulfite exporter TauE/SafE family protein [Alphaproteobacteria bacterium]